MDCLSIRLAAGLFVIKKWISGIFFIFSETPRTFAHVLEII